MSGNSEDGGCVWCGTDERCYSRSEQVTCTTNLQTASCPGVCPLLSTCNACTLLSCTWCPSTRTCHSFEASSCPGPDYGIDEPSEAGSLTGVTLVESCGETAALGLTYTLYRPPADFARPDVVGISNGSILTMDAREEFRGARDAQGSDVGVEVGRLTGFLLPMRKDMALKLRAELLNATLVVDDTDRQFVFADGKTSRSSPEELKFSDAPGSVHRVQMEARSKGTMSLIWFGDKGAPVEVPRNQLRLHRSGVSCSNNTNCLACVTDSACGWCPVANKNRGACIQNNSPCRASNTYEYGDWVRTSADDAADYFHVLVPSECQVCLQHIYCSDCTSDPDCEWLPDTAHCTRRGRFLSLAVTDPATCPPECHTRTSCTQCLGTAGRCAWCQHTQVWFKFLYV